MTATAVTLGRTVVCIRDLVPLVDARPDGAKLDVAALVRALTPTQADVVAAIRELVEAGALDPQTLRSPSVGASVLAPEPNALHENRDVTPASDAGEREAGGESTPPPASNPPAPVSGLAERPTGAELAAALESYARQHDLALTRVGRHLFAGAGAVGRLAKIRRPYDDTVAKVQAFLVGPPPAELKRQQSGGPRVTNNGGVTGAELAAELDAIIARHGLSKVTVGQFLFHRGGGVETLRQSAFPRRETVAKVRALVADPPLDKLRPKRRAKAKAAAPPRAAAPVTLEPWTPRKPAAVDKPVRRVSAAVNTPARRRLQAEAQKHIAAGTMAPAGNVRVVQLAIQDRQKEQDRLADPFEQARSKLQRTKVVYCATVSGGRADRFIVSGCRREVTKAEIIALAAGELTCRQINEGAKA